MPLRKWRVVCVADKPHRGPTPRGAVAGFAFGGALDAGPDLLALPLPRLRRRGFCWVGSGCRFELAHQEDSRFMVTGMDSEENPGVPAGYLLAEITAGRNGVVTLWRR